MPTEPTFAVMTEWISILGPLTNAVGTLVIAIATVVYVYFTRKLWIETARNAELTEKMMKASNEPLCSIANLTHSVNACGTLILSFRIQNAGSVPVDSVHLVTEWKGARSSDPEGTYNNAEWLGVLLPGQTTELMRSIVVDRPAKRLTARHGDREIYEIALVHVGLSLRFQNSRWSPSSKLHVLLAEFRLEDQSLRVCKSEIVETDSTDYRVYHLLDDIGPTGRSEVTVAGSEGRVFRGSRHRPTGHP